MSEEQGPLILCMENAAGEEISLRIEPEDDFRTFLDKAKSILGFDIDINSITRNQPVSLDDNIYQFLINTDQVETELDLSENLDAALERDDLVYILDDGTQIRASQIHFDNEDPHVDLTAEKIPFVKYADSVSDELDSENVKEEDTRKYNIVESPVSRWPSQSSSPKSFVNRLPFKLVCNNTSSFEAQFNKYLETNSKTYATLNPAINRTKSPRSVISENYKKYDENFNKNDDVVFTREAVLNMFKDSPVASLPYESNVLDKRKHVRKTDPSRLVHKSWNPKPYDDVVVIADNENRDCFICGKYVETDKLYLFDKEDQKIHRSSPQRKTSTQLKIICEICLGKNFKPCRMKGPNQYLSSDEYLVIKNNQQYIFQKTNDFTYNRGLSVNDSIDFNAPVSKDNENMEFVKVEIGSDGEIITKPIDNDLDSSDDVIVVKDDGKDDSSSGVEIIEPQEIDDIVIDNLDEADERVKEFLGKYHCDENAESSELKCRFCMKIFATITEVTEHNELHKYEYEDGVVYPCPLCDYGYANVKWLRGHLKAAHEKREKDVNKDSTGNEGEDIKSKSASPIAKRTRSAIKKSDGDEKPTENSEIEEIKQTELNHASPDCGQLTTTVKVEVKQERQESSDDEIWIVQATDDGQLDQLLHTAEDKNKENKPSKKTFKCINCSQTFTSAEGLSSHKCRRRGRKPKAQSKGNILCVPTKEDFIKRAQGRLRPVERPSNDLLVERPRKRKSKQPTSDPQIVTCHNCNESFTSKVRLKFHMQFHEATGMLSNGKYSCLECANATFNTESELFDHVHFQHDKQKRWQCPVAGCGKTFYLRATLTKHSRVHTDTRRYVCVTCGKRFLDKQTLDEHGVTHLQIKPFQCHVCLKQLTRRSRLRMHLRAHEEELTPKLVLVCAVCSRAFRDQQDAQEHAIRSSECIQEFTNELKEEEDVQLSPTSGLVRQAVHVADSPKLKKPVQRQVEATLAEPLLASLADEARSIIRVVEIEKAFRCEYCEDIFYLEDALNKHRLIHKGVKNPFTCHICKVTFATYSRCTTHKTTHGFYKRPLADAKKQAKTEALEAGPSATGILGYGGFPVVKHFLCEDCGRSYLHWTYLQVHRRMKHANQNFMYKCSQCEVTFPNSWSLAYHRKKMHGKEDGNITKSTKEDYRIPCRDCDEVLPNKTALYKHRKKEHSDMSLGNGKSDTFWCSQQSVEDPEYYREVAGSNSGAAAARGYGCRECGRNFRTASMRNEHFRIHTGERPYPCDLCGVAFRRSTAMRNHRLIHTGVRAWACGRCPKRFRIRSDLRTHVRLKHPAYLAVIEVVGLNPSPEEVMEQLQKNNIPQEKVIEISKMSFNKGTRSLVPSSARALSLLGGVPRTVTCSRPLLPYSESQPARRGRGIAKNPRRPKILQRGGTPPSEPCKYPMTLAVTGEDLTEADVQLLLRDGMLVNGNQMVQLGLDDNMLIE